MSHRDQSISQTIGAIYDAVLDTALWPQAFAAIGRQVRGDHVIFFTQDTNANRMRLVTGIGVGLDFFARLGAAVAADILPFSFPTMPAVEARPLGSLCDKSTFDRTDFYNNVVRPDGGFDGLLAVPFRQDGHIGVLAVERLRTAPDYDGDDVDALQAVLPHLSNALRIRLKLEDADAAAQQTYGAFDLLDFGVIVVDARMRPVFMNRRAERVTSCNDGLSVGRDGLRAARAEETDTLRRAVRAAIETATLKRRNGQEIYKVEPCAVRLRLLRPSRAGFGCDSHALEPRERRAAHRAAGARRHIRRAT